MTERIAVYVDGANAYFAQKEALGWWIDWPKFLRVMSEGKDITSARWYQAYRVSPEPEQERFLHHLTLVGFAVRKKVLKQVFDRASGGHVVKGDLDVDMAVDALTEADRYDTCIFVTGDSDFQPLVEALQHRGKRVIVVATPQNVAVELRQAVGVNFIDLSDLQSRIESDKPRPAVEERRSPAPPAAARVATRPVEDDEEWDEEEYDEDGEYEEEYDEDDAYDAQLPNGNRRHVDNGFRYDDDDMGSPAPPHPDDIELPVEGEIVQCHVQAVKKYGVFLDLHEHAKTLLHVKDMNRGFVPDAGEFYEVGEEIPVQVVSVDRTKNPPEVRVSVVSAEAEH